MSTNINLGCSMTISKYDRNLSDTIIEKVARLIIKDADGNIVYNNNYSSKCVNQSETEWYYLSGAELIYYRPDKQFYRLTKLPDPELIKNNYILLPVLHLIFKPPEYRIYGDDTNIYDIPPIHITDRDFIIFNMAYYPKYYVYNNKTDEYKIFDLQICGVDKKKLKNIESANYNKISSHIENITYDNGNVKNVLIIINSEKRIKVSIDITGLLKPDNKHIVYDLLRDDTTEGNKILLMLNNINIKVNNVSYAVSDDNTELIITDKRTGDRVCLELDNKTNNNITNILLKYPVINILDYITY